MCMSLHGTSPWLGRLRVAMPLFNHVAARNRGRFVPQNAPQSHHGADARVFQSATCGLVVQDHRWQAGRLRGYWPFERFSGALGGAARFLVVADRFCQHQA